MKLIDAHKLEEELKRYMKMQDDVAKQYNIADGTYVNLQRAVVLNVLEIVEKQPTAEQGKVAKWYRSKGVQLSDGDEDAVD